MVENYIDGGILGIDDESEELKKEIEERRKRKIKGTEDYNPNKINSDSMEYGN
jgi:hypothetical protein